MSFEIYYILRRKVITLWVDLITICNDRYYILRCNRHFYASQYKIGSQVVDTGRGGRGGEIVSPVSFWVNNCIKRKLTTF